jgi:hypothetical protein
MHVLNPFLGHVLLFFFIIYLFQVSQDMNKTYAALFSPFWNEIIKSLREEDYISNR